MRLPGTESGDEAGGSVVSESQDIREWAKARGEQVSDKGRLPAELKARYQAEHNGTGDGTPRELLPAPETPPTPPPPPTPVAATAGGEKPPTSPGGPRRGLFRRHPPGGGDKPVAPAGRHPKRLSLENVFGTGWAMAGMALMRSPSAIPTARVLQYQAPVAGVIADDIFAGTVVDRLLQPLARAGERGEKVAALIGPPLVIEITRRYPQLAPTTRPIFEMLMLSWVDIAGPAMVKVQQRMDKAQEQMGGIDAGAIWDQIWADIEVPVDHSPEEEAAIRRARGDGN